MSVQIFTNKLSEKARLVFQVFKREIDQIDQSLTPAAVCECEKISDEKAIIKISLQNKVLHLISVPITNIDYPFAHIKNPLLSASLVYCLIKIGNRYAYPNGYDIFRFDLKGKRSLRFSQGTRITQCPNLSSGAVFSPVDESIIYIRHDNVGYNTRDSFECSHSLFDIMEDKIVFSVRQPIEQRLQLTERKGCIIKYTSKKEFDVYNWRTSTILFSGKSRHVQLMGRLLSVYEKDLLMCFYDIETGERIFKMRAYPPIATHSKLNRHTMYFRGEHHMAQLCVLEPREELLRTIYAFVQARIFPVHVLVEIVATLQYFRNVTRHFLFHHAQRLHLSCLKIYAEREEKRIITVLN